MAEDKQNQEESLESSLEVNDTIVENSVASTEELNGEHKVKNAVTNEDDVKNYKAPPKTFSKRVKGLIEKINVYFLLFLLVLSLAGFAAYISWKSSKNADKQAGVLGQELSADDLAKIKTTDASVGDPKQTLTIASNAVFNGRVLVRDSLDVAGTIRVGGALSLPGITVSGTSTFESVSVASNLAIAGNTAIQGTLSVQKNLSIAGTASFGGPITTPMLNTDKFNLNSDLQINHHIDAGGPTPEISRGSAVGGSGTVSLNGSDTAGTITVNFGAGSGPGVIANVKFNTGFSQTPHIVISPIGSACAELNYFITKTTTGFSISSTKSGSPGASCSFDYISLG